MNAEQSHVRLTSLPCKQRWTTRGSVSTKTSAFAGITAQDTRCVHVSHTCASSYCFLQPLVYSNKRVVDFLANPWTKIHIRLVLCYGMQSHCWSFYYEIKTYWRYGKHIYTPLRSRGRGGQKNVRTFSQFSASSSEYWRVIHMYIYNKYNII